MFDHLLGSLGQEKEEEVLQLKDFIEKNFSEGIVGSTVATQLILELGGIGEQNILALVFSTWATAIDTYREFLQARGVDTEALEKREPDPF